MAIAGYVNVYDTFGYKQSVDDIAIGISELNGRNFFVDAESKIKDQIKSLKEKEEKIFEKLEVNDIKELNIRLEDYKKAVFNLSGPGLNRAFIGILKEKNRKEFEAFNDAVLSVVNEDILKNQAIIDIGVAKAHEEVINFLNADTSKYVRYSSPKGMTTTEFFPASFTKEQRDRWKALLIEKYSKSQKPAVQKYFEVGASSEGDTLTGEFTWFDITNELTQTEAEERLSDDDIGEINRKIRDLIISKVDDKDSIGLIIDDVLAKEKFAFFVGKNEKEITGLLGEIQGMYYLSKILGNTKVALEWRGGRINPATGKKYHQDILVDIFGIQIKNTINEAFFGLGDVKFADGDIGKLLPKIGISSDAADLFKNYYGTLVFNVPYHRDKRRKKGAQYLPGLRESDRGAERYKEQRERLEGHEKDIDRLLSLFAATFMYLDVSENAGSLDANTLFLLGGAAFQTASQILSDVLEDLEKEKKRFKVRGSLKKDKNIITALNTRNRKPDYSTLVAADIKLTSSFNFGSLS